MYKIVILIIIMIIQSEITCINLHEVNKGDNLTLECPIQNHHSKSSTQNDLLIKWFKNNDKLTWLNRRIRIQDEKLKIKTAFESDSGVYMCQIVSGTEGLVQSYNITLKVKSSTNLTRTTIKINSDYDELTQENEQYNEQQEQEQQQDYDYIKAEAPTFDDLDELVNKMFNQLEGSQIELNCNARGVPMPEIQWYKNARIISEEEIGNIRTSMTLHIRDLSTRDSGNYTCVVSNSIGRTNRTFQVTILETLKFIGEEPLNQTNIILGTNVAFTCQIVGNAKIAWFTNSRIHTKLVNKQRAFNMSVEIDGDVYYQLNEVTLNTQLNLHNTIYPQDRFMSSIKIDLEHGSRLMLENVQLNDIGYYLCIANNSKGYNYRKAYLNVIDQSTFVTQASHKSLSNFLSNSALLTILLAFSSFVFVLVVTLVCKNRLNNKRVKSELIKKHQQQLPKKVLAVSTSSSITPQSTLITSSLRKSTNSSSLNYNRSLPRQQQPIIQMSQPQLISSPTPSHFKRNLTVSQSQRNAYKYQPCVCVVDTQQQAVAKPQYDNFCAIQISSQASHPSSFNSDMINWSDSSSASRPYAKIQYQ